MIARSAEFLFNPFRQRIGVAKPLWTNIHAFPATPHFKLVWQPSHGHTTSGALAVAALSLTLAGLPIFIFSPFGTTV